MSHAEREQESLPPMNVVVLTYKILASFGDPSVRSVALLAWGWIAGSRPGIGVGVQGCCIGVGAPG